MQIYNRELARTNALMRMTRRSLVRATSQEVRTVFSAKLMKLAEKKLEIQAEILKHNESDLRTKY